MNSNIFDVDSLESQIISIIAKEICGGDVSRITLKSTFEDLKIDSLDAVNITFNLEDELQIEIDPEEVQDVKSIGDLVERVRARFQEQPAIALESAA